MKYIIFTIINGREHYLSETMKILHDRYAPGLDKKIDLALTFDTKQEALETIAKIRDMHGRKYETARIKTTSKKSFAAYTRSELN